MKRILLAVLCALTLFASGSESFPVLPAPEIVQTAAVDNAEPEASVSTPAPEATPEPTPANTPAQESLAALPVRINVLAAGDLMCLSSQLRAARKNGAYEFDYCFNEIKSKISAADLAIANFETLVAEGYPYTGHSSSGNPLLNAPESYLSAVVNSGFDVLINANNHIFDRKLDGLNKTINLIDEYGVYHTGAYPEGQQRAPLIVNVKGINIAVFGYTGHINGHPRGATMADMYNEDVVAADMKAAKRAGADFIIVYIHWGNENTHKVTKRQKTMAAFIAGAGADIIIGSHPHCTQGTDVIATDHGNVPVFYSLGNLISSMGRTINKDSALVNMTLVKNPATAETGISELTYTPTLCASTDAGGYVILPADQNSIPLSAKAKALSASRARTVKVMGESVAKPE